jgi:TM2 domain-containing membrane protein YozV
MSDGETGQANVEQGSSESDQQQNETDQASSKSGGDRQLRHDEVFCSSCGSAIKEDAQMCPECGVAQNGGSGTGERNPGIAAILSFLFGGGGQIYNGQIGKGIAIILIQMVNLGLMFVVIGFLTWPATAIYSVYDAYNTAKKINQGEINP